MEEKAQKTNIYTMRFVTRQTKRYKAYKHWLLDIHRHASRYTKTYNYTHKNMQLYI